MAIEVRYGGTFRNPPSATGDSNIVEFAGFQETKEAGPADAEENAGSLVAVEHALDAQRISRGLGRDCTRYRLSHSW